MKKRAPVLAPLVFVLLLPSAARAQTGQVWTSQDGASSLELRGFVKAFGYGVRTQPGLVAGVQALADLADEAALAYPNVQVPAVVPLPGSGAAGVTTGRVWGRLLWKNRVELSAGWQLDAGVATSRALTAGATPGSAVPVASGSQEALSRRLVDFNPVLVDRGHLLVTDNLDLLAIKVTWPRGELAAGRQVLSWGTGRFWNPTDLLSPFAPTDVDREVRHGVDAVRYSMPLGKTSLLDVLYLPQQEGWAQGGVARVQANVHRFDVSVSAAKYVTDLVLGADTAGDLGPIGVHAEAAYTRGLPNHDPQRSVEAHDRFVRAVAGVDWRPASKWLLSAEYYFNGFGAADPAGYAAKLRSGRVARGEIAGAGRQYVGCSTSFRATELVTLQAVLLGNLADPSALVIPVVEDWAAQNVLLRVGGYAPIGARPDPSSLEALGVEDLVLRTPAFASATSSLGFRSEYGASPWGVFAQLGVYF
jgi:hypothetical protein